jgi:hypothetical protein
MHSIFGRNWFAVESFEDRVTESMQQSLPMVCYNNNLWPVRRVTELCTAF